MSGFIVLFLGFVALVLVLAILASLTQQSEKNQYGIESVTLTGQKVKSLGEKLLETFFSQSLM